MLLIIKVLQVICVSNVKIAAFAHTLTASKLINVSNATVAPLLSAAFACLRNLVRQDVVLTVNVEYAIIVMAVMAAKLTPY